MKNWLTYSFLFLAAFAVILISCKSNHTESVYSGFIVLCSTDQGGPKTHVGYIDDGELAFVPFSGSSASAIVFVMKEDEAGEFKLDGSMPNETGLKDKDDGQWYCTTDVDWPSSWPAVEFQAHSEGVDHVRLQQDSIDDLPYFVGEGGSINESLDIDLNAVRDGSNMEVDSEDIQITVGSQAAILQEYMEISHVEANPAGQIVEIIVQEDDPEIDIEINEDLVKTIRWTGVNCSSVSYQSGHFCGSAQYTDVRMYPTGSTGYIYLCDDGTANVTVDDAEKLCDD